MFETGGKSPAEWMNEGMMARLGSGMREGMPLVQIDEEEDEPVEIVRSTNINLAYRAPEDTEDDDDEVEDCVDDVSEKVIEKEPVPIRNGLDQDGEFIDDEEDMPLDHEALFSVGKMAELLENGTDHERGIILFEIQQLLDHCLEDTLKILVPILCLHVHTWSPELQLGASEALIDVVHHEIPPEVAKMISAASFRVVNRAVVDTIYEAWGEILVAVLPNVSWNEQELERVIALIDVHARRNNEISRKLAARVLGALCICLTPAEVEKHILQRALDLCEDEDVEVRGMVTESLQFIGAALSIDVTEEQIWPKILQLLDDLDARIHAATLRSIAHLVETHREKEGNKRLYRDQLPPVFLKHCEFSRKAAAEDQRTVDDDSYLLLEIFSEVFGPFLASSYVHITDENQRKDVYKAFLGNATCNGPVVRRHCAFNMPGVAESLGSKYNVELSNIVEFLSRDTDAETRWNLAAGIHITTSLLVSKPTVENLFKSIVGLLRDDNPLVRMNTLQHFCELLTAIMIEGEYSSAVKLSPIFRNLRLLSEGNWRTQELLAEQLNQAAKLIPQEALKVNVLPLLFQMAEESTFLVRKAAMSAIVNCFRYIPQLEERNQLLESFCVEWAQGGVFWMRNSFLEAALAAFKVYSRALFKQCFATQILRLFGDPVPNVRLRLAHVLGIIGVALEDDPQFMGTVQMLQLDEDQDVRDAIEALPEKLEAERARQENWEEEDRRRLEEEEEIVRKYHAEKMSKKIPGIKKMLVKTFGVKSEMSSPMQSSQISVSPPKPAQSDLKSNKTSQSRTNSELSSDRNSRFGYVTLSEPHSVNADNLTAMSSPAVNGDGGTKTTWGTDRNDPTRTSGRKVMKQIGSLLKPRRRQNKEPN